MKIDKQKVLELIIAHMGFNDIGLKAAINALPTSDDGWVKCEDGLPKDMDEVLVIDSREIIGTAVYSSDKKSKGQKCWFNVHAQKWIGDIAAWQPLPTPPTK